jgi:O-antigen ligase
VAVITTLIWLVAVRPTNRKSVISAVAVFGLLAASPFALQKLNERFESGAEGFRMDPERLAFERAAGFMIDDHPWGVGINQYVTVANEGGYLDRAGVRWQPEARSTNVHNAYLLTRVEGGLIGLAGFMIWLLTPILFALRMSARNGTPQREISIAASVALAVTAVHSLFEWVVITIVPQYLTASLIGIIAACAYAREAKPRAKALRGRVISKVKALRPPDDHNPFGYTSASRRSDADAGHGSI